MPINMGARPPKNYAQMTASEREDFNPINQLLIPRLRYLQSPQETSTETLRIVRRHDVAWYVRPLPPGWHASPEAIENARKKGVTLEPNETFVKAHERGVDHKVLGYHAVRRSTELRAGQDY